MNTQLLTVKEVQTTLRLGSTKMTELISDGEIKTLKIGRRRLVTPQALEQFIERKLSEQVAV